MRFRVSLEQEGRYELGATLEMLLFVLGRSSALCCLLCRFVSEMRVYSHFANSGGNDGRVVQLERHRPRDLHRRRQFP